MTTFDKSTKFLKKTILFLLIICTGYLGYTVYTIKYAIKISGDYAYANQHSSPQEATANQRIAAWKKLIRENRSLNVKILLEKVNNFFNQLTYIPDTPLQGSADVWLTPQEFLEAGGGDCEDFAIAKYFTLVALGIPEEKLRITYVTIRPDNKPHMVLTYYPKPEEQPLILDNLVAKILPAPERMDLIPVYSFNAEEVWLYERIDRARPYGKASSLSKWQALIERIKLQGEYK
ncbi:transglutaminase-like cysteine peptidase [Legionella septentrionalis]|uniref:transglutaminase-like cysteine peptidase n=1 Tax=Legionella septentrionalis TaxID=2498109 RepID=UPI000F8C7840|nr:transglutaminase-like cysteine peptidase [Legionella septentrionalis]RUQ96540.1 hypothetical protein ELY11_07640 [Legionella septentrionalis]